MFLHSSLLKIWDFFHLCEKFYVFSHSWKKSQIFNRGLCKNVLFLYTCQTSRHGILEGCRALLPLVPYPKRPRAFFGSFKKLVLKLPFSCQKYRSMCMICQLTDYITKFDTCCMVWVVNYRWSKAINLNWRSFILVKEINKIIEVLADCGVQLGTLLILNLLKISVTAARCYKYP
jgi:hypothetical protein